VSFGRSTRPAVAALLWALAVGARAAPATGARPRIAEIVLSLPPGENAAAVRDLVAVKVGEPLAPRALRRTVQLLYGLGRFGNVVARTRPAADAPGDVVLVLECLPRRVVASLRIVNRAAHPALDEERIRRIAALAPGDELWRGRLDEAAARVRAAYARRGYRRAEVRAAAEGDPQARVQLAVDEGPPTRLGAVVVGRPGAGASEPLGHGLATQPGAVLDLDALDADVRALRARLRRDGFLRARVGTPAVTMDGESARVEIPVEAGPHVEFRFTGQEAFAVAELRPHLGLEPEQALDTPAIEAAAARVRTFYQAHGYADARVSAAEVPVPGGAAVVFRIDERRPFRVRGVRFPGATQRSPAWLRARLDEALDLLSPGDGGGANADAERLARAAGSPAAVRSRAPVEPRAVWNPPVWDAAALKLVELYRADGFLDAALDGTRVALDARAGTVDVEIELHEGVRTRVEAVAFEGNAAVLLPDLVREARLSPGDPLAFGAVEATRAALLGLYARRGYLYARVADAEELTPDHARATVRFRIEEGPQVRVGSVVVNGNRRTREAVVRETLALHPGEVYDPEVVARSQAALLRLGVFRSVGLHLTDPDVPDTTKDLTIELAERPWQTLAPGFGFSLANGPRAFIELVQPNLAGRALELSARAKVNYPLGTFRPDLVGKAPVDRIEGRGDVGLHDPRIHFFGLPAGARLDMIAERLHRRAYDVGRASAVVGLDLPATSRMTLSLQYELEVDHIQKSDALAGLALTRADVDRLRFPQGFTTLHSVRPVLAVDYRDNALRPRSGWMASGTADYAHSIGGAGESLLFGIIRGSTVFTHMVKLSGAVTGYLPIASQSVLALSVRGGRVVALDPASQTIGPKRFFLGGAATMRGYGEDEMIPEDVRSAYLDQVRACAGSLSGLGCSSVAQQLSQGQTLVSEGGEAFVLAKAELRVPLRESIEAGLFTDIGNLWLDPRQATIADLRLNVGFGLRFASPVGPAVVDFGFNVTPDGRLGEKLFAPHFSIGLF